ncbi:hypothetical protein GCM10009759_69640 [Kitasatospora saccharophila]|uniref:Uncharacterized protein n=1 Tax=Kitasatospora saccharophila TaxID=407973 RepID=A0ABN2Y129_9ACTN
MASTHPRNRARSKSLQGPRATIPPRRPRRPRPKPVPTPAQNGPQAADRFRIVLRPVRPTAQRAYEIELFGDLD